MYKGNRDEHEKLISNPIPKGFYWIPIRDPGLTLIIQDFLYFNASALSSNVFEVKIFTATNECFIMIVTFFPLGKCRDIINGGARS